MSARARWERWLPLLWLALATLALWPIFRHPDRFAVQYDWRYFQSWIEVGRRSIAWFHQVPLWNPYGCGGEVLLANPQSEVASPTFLLPLLFGTALGIKLTLLVYYFCAFDGMYRLARRHEVQPLAAGFAAVLFGTGGWLALHLSSGHSNFASAALFPYLVICYQRGRDEVEWTIPLGAIAAWIVGLGGTSTPAMATVLLGTLGAIDCVKRRSLLPLRTLALGAGCAALLGAARVLPALEFAIDHPRRQWETDANTIFEIIRNGYWWKGLEGVRGKRYWFHEYGWKLAYVTPPFILWSLVVKRTRGWWIVVLVGAGIVAGAAIPYGPWWLLKHLPIFRDLRVPSRYAIFLALALALLCAAALDDLIRRLRRPRLAQAAAGLVILAALVDGVLYTHGRWQGVFDLPMTVAGRDARFYQERGEWRVMMNHVMAGHGAIGCDEEAPLQRAAELDLGDVPQVRLADPAAGEVRAIRFTPNRIEADVTLRREATVLFNQNWNEHFRTTHGRVVKHGPKHPRDRDGGRLAVEAPAGTYTLAVYYRPRSFVVGAAISLVAIPLATFLFVWRRRRSTN